MGVIYDPAYANIFMGNFELKYIYPYRRDKAKIFLRFIDELFLIWTGSEQELLDFMSDLNKKHPLIKFEFKYSQIKIEFLDVLAYKDHNNMLQATIYRKQEFLNHTAKKINQFQKRGYNRSLIEQQIGKANLQEKNNFLISIYRSNTIEHSLK